MIDASGEAQTSRDGKQQTHNDHDARNTLRKEASLHFLEVVSPTNKSRRRLVRDVSSFFFVGNLRWLHLLDNFNKSYIYVLGSIGIPCCSI